MATNKKNSPAPATTTEAPAPAPETTAVVTQGTTAISAFDFGENAGLGLDSIAGALLKLPFFQLVQKGTPGVDKKDDILYQQVGNFYDPLSRKIYQGDVGLKGVMISTAEYFVERTPMKEGRKFQGKHLRSSDVVKAGIKRTEAENKLEKDKHGYGKVKAPEGDNDLIETHECLVVLEDPDGDRFGCVLKFSSSAIPYLQKWMTGVVNNRTLPDGSKAPGGKIPLCANEFKLTAEFKEGKGFSWHVPNIQPLQEDYASSIKIGPGSLYEDAIAQHKAMKAGKIVVDEETFDAVEDGDNSHDGSDKMKW